MHTLFLDTASADQVLILLTEEKVLMKKAIPKQGESHVTRNLEEALEETGWRYEDHVNSQGEHVAGLTRIACTTGPGGFVSLRVGITTANVLSRLLDIPLAGVHLSELWEARSRGHRTVDLGLGSEEHSFLWLHSTRKAQLFVRGFGEFAEKYPEPTLIDLEEASALKTSYVGELIEEHRKALPECTPLSPDYLSPLEEILPGYLSKLTYKKGQVHPWYGREA